MCGRGKIIARPRHRQRSHIIKCITFTRCSSKKKKQILQYDDLRLTLPLYACPETKAVSLEICSLYKLVINVLSKDISTMALRHSNNELNLKPLSRSDNQSALLSTCACYAQETVCKRKHMSAGEILFLMEIL